MYASDTEVTLRCIAKRACAYMQIDQHEMPALSASDVT